MKGWSSDEKRAIRADDVGHEVRVDRGLEASATSADVGRLYPVLGPTRLCREHPWDFLGRRGGSRTLTSTLNEAIAPVGRIGRTRALWVEPQCP